MYLVNFLNYRSFCIFKVAFLFFLKGAIPYIIYIGIHLYFEIFTAIPAGILLGLGASIIWAGEGAYLTASARSYSKAEKKEDGDALGRFNGIFWAIFQVINKPSS